MNFAWPFALLSLLSVPILLGVYVWQLKRKRKSAVVFSNLALIKAAMPARASWKRHIPVALFLAGLTGLGLATARPQASVKVPFARTSIILALDVSRSMCSTDVQPNRLSVAQDAARSFVKGQPKGTRIGLVVFAGFAQLTVPPTSDTAPLVDAINGLTTAKGTAIGAATFKALDAIAAVNPSVAPIGTDLASKADIGSSFDPNDPPAFNEEYIDPPTEKAPAPPEGYIPDIVVLLTDGANTRGIDPLIAAREAAKRRVRVYTIGFGTEEPTDMVCTPSQLGTDGLEDHINPGGPLTGGGQINGDPVARRAILKIDEPTLRGVSNMTGGEFFKAEDANQLRKVFNNLPKQVTLQKRNVEISVAFVIASALLAVAAMVLSLRWNRSP